MWGYRLLSSARRDGIAALAICLGVAVPPAAQAAVPSPPDGAALSVYVESVPTSQGPTPFWGLPSARRHSVPRATQRRIDARGGADAGALGRVAATVPTATRVERAGAAGERKSGIGGEPTSWQSSVRAAAGPALRQHRAALAVIALATVALLWAAARRRREETGQTTRAAARELSR